MGDITWSPMAAEPSLPMKWTILDGVTLGVTLGAEGCDPAMVEGDHNIEKEVHVAARQVLVKMHMANWATAQREDPVLDVVLNWLEAQKKTDLRTLLGEHASSEEGRMVWRNHQNFMTLQNALYLCSTPKREIRIYYSLWCQRHIRLPL